MSQLTMVGCWLSLSVWAADAAERICYDVGSWSFWLGLVLLQYWRQPTRLTAFSTSLTRRSHDDYSRH